MTEQIFKIASMEPGAMLYEASREFEVRYLRYIGSHKFCLCPGHAGLSSTVGS